MRLGFGVTFLSARLHHGRLDGIGVYTKAIWEALRDSSMELYPLSFNSGASLELTQNLLGVDISATPLSYPIHSGLSVLAHRSLGELIEYEKKIDIFFAPDHHIPFLRDTPVVATVMDIIPFIHPQWASSRLRRTKNYTFKKAVKSATHIITISQHSKKDIVEHLGIGEDKISVVPLGVDERFFARVLDRDKEKIRDKYSIDRDFFLFVGTLQPRKNILRIIEAYMQLPQDIKDDTMLVLVGQDGWESNELRDKIDDMVRSNSGIWLSYIPQDDIYGLMQSAKAIVYPSLYEGFGLPIIEGFASRTPVITSDITSMPEVAGDAAILVDPYSIDEISNAMDRLSKDSKLCERMAHLGYIRAEQFSWQNSIKRHIEVFDLLVN